MTARPDDPADAVRRLGPTGAVPDGDGVGRHVARRRHRVDRDGRGRQAQAVAAAVDGEITDTLPAGFGERPWTAGGIGLKVTHRLGALRETLAAIDKRSS